MLRWIVGTTVVVLMVCVRHVSAEEFQYEGTLCEGFDIHRYYQQLDQHRYNQKMSYVMAVRAAEMQAFADQRSAEMIVQARRTQFAKEARLRQETIAKLKAANGSIANTAKNSAKKSPAITATAKLDKAP